MYPVSEIFVYSLYWKVLKSLLATLATVTIQLNKMLSKVIGLVQNRKLLK